MTGDQPPPLSFDDDTDLFAVPSKPPATRRDDHDTSTKAAALAAVAQHTIRFQVTMFAHNAGAVGFIDDQLVEAHPDSPESSYRKRRSELTQDEMLVDSGRRRQNRQGNDETVWVHRDHMPGVQCHTRASPDEWRTLKNRAAMQVPELNRAATQMHSEGRVALGRMIKDAADTLRQLSA